MLPAQKGRSGGSEGCLLKSRLASHFPCCCFQVPLSRTIDMPWCDCHLVLPSLPPKTVLDSSAPHSGASTGANVVLAVPEEGETPGSPYKAAFQHCFVDFFLAGREERGGMKVNNYLNKHTFQWIKSASTNQARLQLCRAILGATKKNLVLNTS